MANLTLTAANISPVHSRDAIIRAHRAAVAILAGQSITLNAAGKYVLAAAATAGAEETDGVALNAAAIGETVNCLRQGGVAGFDVSALAVDAVIYQSDTAGALSTTAGTKAVEVGRVACRNDPPDFSKFIEIVLRPAKRR